NSVWIAVLTEQNIVAVAAPRHDVDVTNAEKVGNLARQPKFFVGHSPRSNDRNVGTDDLPELQRRLIDRALPVHRRQFFPVRNFRPEQTVLRFQIFEIQSAVVAHPARVHVIVLARRLPIHDVFAGPDQGVATGRATGANTFRFFQEPDPHFETKIGRSERADRTKIDRVQRIIVFQTFARMRGQHRVTAAVDKAEDVVVRDFVAEANAARAENAALIIERDAWPELHRFWFFDFVFEKARTFRAVLNAEFLQLTFTGLIADRAIERVIDQQKFHHAFAAFFDHGRIGAYAHAFGDVLRATDLRTQHPIDDRFLVGPEFRFTVGTHSRHS